MKKFLVTIVAITGFAMIGKTQVHVNQNGTPDMRYKENKQVYGTPSYSTPSNNTPNYNSPSYNNPTYNKPANSNYQTYPTKQNGTPDMRYKENKQLYGTPKYY